MNSTLLKSSLGSLPINQMWVSYHNSERSQLQKKLRIFIETLLLYKWKLFEKPIFTICSVCLFWHLFTASDV